MYRAMGTIDMKVFITLSFCYRKSKWRKKERVFGSLSTVTACLLQVCNIFVTEFGNIANGQIISWMLVGRIINTTKMSLTYIYGAGKTPIGIFCLSNMHRPQVCY